MGAKQRRPQRVIIEIAIAFGDHRKVHRETWSRNQKNASAESSRRGN
ncbi:MAG: hypothetical protein IPL59_22415 [Candidatus Competibacteraceae bacterium]|nr:hypothetical protein [Candidatus Competibacteraceae bacterium]